MPRSCPEAVELFAWPLVSLARCLWGGSGSDVLVVVWCGGDVLVVMWCGGDVLVVVWCGGDVLVVVWWGGDVLVVMWCDGDDGGSYVVKW